MTLALKACLRILSGSRWSVSRWMCAAQAVWSGRLFEALLTVDADSPAALSALADWYWFYRKRDRALSCYRQACARAPDSFTQAAPLPEHPKLAYELAGGDQSG